MFNEVRYVVELWQLDALVDISNVTDGRAPNSVSRSSNNNLLYI